MTSILTHPDDEGFVYVIHEETVSSEGVAQEQPGMSTGAKVALGLLAVGVVVGGGYLLMGGDKERKSNPTPQRSRPTSSTGFQYLAQVFLDAFQKGVFVSKASPSSEDTGQRVVLNVYGDMKGSIEKGAIAGGFSTDRFREAPGFHLYMPVQGKGELAQAEAIQAYLKNFGIQTDITMPTRLPRYPEVFRHVPRVFYAPG